MAPSHGADPPTNFAHLQRHDQQLVRLGTLAERYFTDDPNTAVMKLRQLAELLAQLVATKVGLYTSQRESQYELLHRLQDQGILPREIAQLFGEVRRAGNAANHEIVGDHRAALVTLKLTWQLGIWFHRTFADAAFKPAPFLAPSAATLSKGATEQALRDKIAAEVVKAQPAVESKLAAEQTLGEGQTKGKLADMVTAATQAANEVELDEADTRKLIDEQLREVGWTVDSAALTYAKGARPEKGKNLAIAEWPTDSGPADYVLFVGLMPVAAVEAKRKNVDVSGALQQAKRYSGSFKPPAGLGSPGGPWRGLKLPFIFSSNGRPYLRQLATRSGIWFRDLRDANNFGRALDGWYTPDGLIALLKRDEQQAHAQLKSEPFAYGFPLRAYQQAAIEAIEAAIAAGQRAMLLAMATGTGKTKTCIALLYRLLKTKRFRRVLFLVDRSALGEQAVNAFKDTRMESLQTFADVFGIKDLDEQAPDADTAVHVATVQGMVQRVQNTREGVAPPAVDQYDCIVVDECHRGYLLDRDLSDTELGFRSFDDYISKYRRVLDYFDAVKIGLTATPALHTTDIFGLPIFSYGYREAVIDGYLVDHEPPVQIQTQLSKEGIVWKPGEQVTVYDPRRSKVELFTTPDEIRIEVEDFNRKVITESFNQVVCEVLAREIDPSAPHKTLIFCANDAHADLVVDLLKKSFAKQYGSVEDDAVLKITGAADKPLQLIRRYKNERNPSVAVTVDLLTTGVDVPQISNLVFLRRISSRILFDQMLGRATRLCPEIGKEVFRVFDAVKIFEALQNLSEMQPVVVDPAISFSQLVRELTEVTTDEERTLVRDQLVAKIQRKKRYLSDEQAQDFEALAGQPPEAFVKKLRAMPLLELAGFFKKHQKLGELLDRKEYVRQAPIFLSAHEDQLVATERGYGKAQKPEDYLKEFSAFIKSQGNALPALTTVLTRPRELTRKQLRELALALDRAGFSEAHLATAWREATNQDIAARIIGYIRQAAIGDALVPFDQRVDRALQKLLTTKSWSTPQRQWLQKIASQTKANQIVDRAALDDPDQVFRREGGGFARLDRIFEGTLQQVLDSFNESLWSSAA
jgi:type I restriction enzyme R subunit